MGGVAEVGAGAVDEEETTVPLPGRLEPTIATYRVDAVLERSVGSESLDRSGSDDIGSQLGYWFPACLVARRI